MLLLLKKGKKPILGFNIQVGLGMVKLLRPGLLEDLGVDVDVCVTRSMVGFSGIYFRCEV